MKVRCPCKTLFNTQCVGTQTGPIQKGRRSVWNIVSITVLKYSTLVEFQVLWTKRVLWTNKVFRTKKFVQTSHRVTLGPWLVRSFIQTETN